MAARFGAAHPRQLLDRLANSLEIDAEEVAAQTTGQHFFQLGAPHFAQSVRDLNFVHRKQRQARHPDEGCDPAKPLAAAANSRSDTAAISCGRFHIDHPRVARERTRMTSASYEMPATRAAIGTSE